MPQRRESRRAGDVRVTFAIVPACGHSTRMGRPKLALPLGTRTVIEHVVSTLRAGGVERVLVVTGPHVPELIPLAGAAGAEVLTLAESTPDMRATVERGLAWIEETSRPAPDDAWVLAPGDCPSFSAQLVGQLREAAIADPTRDAVVPVFHGRRGHPVVLRWRHAAGIRALPPECGINVFVRQLVAWELPVADPHVLSDLDAPADYARFVARTAHDPPGGPETQSGWE